MTAFTDTRPKKRKTPRLTAGSLLFGWFSAFCLLLILKNSQLATEYMTAGLLLCARTVIPSLFPFLVLSELLLSGGVGEELLRRIVPPFRRLWRLPTAGCCAVLLGMLCGSPVGARCVMIAYGHGKLTRQEAEHALSFCNVPSSAFLISAVGVSLWESKPFGILLYAAVLTVSLLTGWICAMTQQKKGDPPSVSERECESIPMELPLRGPRLFTESVRKAAASMVLICAYVVFFSTLVGTLSVVLAPLRLPEAIRALLFGLFELSCGVTHAAALGNAALGATLTAFAAGWSGLSVHCQVLAVCDGQGLSFRRYFLRKLIQGVLCALVVGSAVYLFPALLSGATGC